MSKSVTTSVLFFVLSLESGITVGASIRAGLLSPAPCDAPFWGQVVLSAKAAAADLDVELIVQCDTNDTTYTARRAGISLLNSEPALDYFITGYWSAVTETHLALAHKRDIKTFVINADVIPADRPAVGEPRGKFPGWIGHMVPNDLQASKDLTKILIDRAIQLKLKAADGKIHFAALSLSAATTVSQERIRGFTSEINVNSFAVMDTVIPANRETSPATIVVENLLKQYPYTAIVCASDQYGSWGAVEAIEKSGKKPGKDIIVGGFDWNPNTLLALEDGRITASMFGHFLEGAWAVVLINDYHHGLDFADELGTRIMTPLRPINNQNITQYRKILDPEHWQQVDFKKNSKHHNKNLEKYNLGIEQFLNN